MTNLIKCPDCDKDWGHSYCGTCLGAGFVTGQSATFTDEDQRKQKELDALRAEVVALQEREVESARLIRVSTNEFLRLKQENERLTAERDEAVRLLAAERLLNTFLASDVTWKIL